MLEQYIYNLITADPTLQALLTNGEAGYHLYPAVVPRGVEFTKAVTFSLITTVDSFPTIQSKSYQFGIFSKSHTEAVQISQALAALFNGDNLKTSGGAEVVFSIRVSETDLGFDYDDTLYQREATYNFKLR